MKIYCMLLNHLKLINFFVGTIFSGKSEGKSDFLQNLS